MSPLSGGRPSVSYKDKDKVCRFVCCWIMVKTNASNNENLNKPKLDADSQKVQEVG